MKNLFIIIIISFLNVSASAQLDTLELLEFRALLSQTLSNFDLEKGGKCTDVYGVLFRFDSTGGLIDFELKSRECKCKLKRRDVKKMFHIFHSYNYIKCIRSTHRPYELEGKEILKIFMPFVRE